MGSHKRGDEGFLAGISDLMSGLMIVFLIIAIAYMYSIERTNAENQKLQDSVRGIAEAYRQAQLNMYEQLRLEFRDDLKKWNAEIDRDSLSIRFRDEDVMFESGRSELKSDFKVILRDFFPRYARIVFDRAYADRLYGISIEGHTSSEWGSGITKDEAYFLNMALSQARARAVLSYCYSLKSMRPYRDKMIRYVTANGLSYSRAVHDASGKEDRKRSRRVEFRTVINADQEIRNILNEFQEDELMFGRGFNAAMNEYRL